MFHNLFVSRPGVSAVFKTQRFRVKEPLAGVVIESEALLSQTRCQLQLTENHPWGISLSAPPHETFLLSH